MKKFERLCGIAAPLLIDNIDTDVIIRVEPLFSNVPKDELGRYCFQVLRQREDGSENPDFVLNREPYRDARILLAGANFGCGSSREGAVWALWSMGIRCIIAPSFGGIFQGNCFQNGLLPVTLPQSQIDALVAKMAKNPAAPIAVDLEAETLTACDGTRLPFHVPALRRAALMQGLDDVELTLLREFEIAEFQRRDALARPWIYTTRHPSDATHKA